ncbi:class I SAM-dependent methyltransferase [Candidatus Poribacteria bacterium]|nr:class I SAM-dependent methyltransferase [Candidatus Poribacteria bacterium]
MDRNPWNEIFKEHGAFFGEPHEDMAGIVQLLKSRGAQVVLDLGSGSGRHVVYLAQNGFSVYGLDSSPEGVEITRTRLGGEGLTADLQLQSMMERLPYEDDFFDAVISIQVIHHAKIADIRRTVGEIARVLKKGGFVFVTVPKQRNVCETYQEIEPGTFVPQDGLEKGLPHHYFTPDELREVFKDFETTDIHLDSGEHYCMSSFKR